MNKNIDYIATSTQCYDYILNLFNENNIQFVIIRGFRFLPEKMDTDIDLIIHSESYDKFKELCKHLKDSKLINPNGPRHYIEKIDLTKKTITNDYYYHPLVTHKDLEGRYYRFDTYSDLFFYKNGEGNTNEALVVNNLFKYYLFKNKIKRDNYYIPHPIHEVILLLYRNIYDKKGKWSRKHINRIKDLMKLIEKEQFLFFSNMCFSQKQNIFELIKTEQFEKISYPDQKLNHFVIRKPALKDTVINDILNKIEKNGYTILDKILITIGDTNKFYKDLYKNFNEYEKEIMATNKNQCLLIVTNHILKNPGHFKNSVRKEYASMFSSTPGCPGNIIHCSDSSYDCNKELQLFFKENILSFKNIGTY